jgi:hypothetical protein
MKEGEQKMIKQSVLNTFKRVGINPDDYDNVTKDVEVSNRFSGETVTTTELIAELVDWVYQTSNKYEIGGSTVNLSDFDRIRYFILDQDKEVYITCID